MKGVLIAAQIENVTTRKDRSIKITIGTQELTPEQSSELFGLVHGICAVYISEKKASQEEIDLVDKVNPEFGGKTQSQRIRNVMFKLFEQANEGFKDFDSYYHSKTEKYIDHLKAKIQQPF